MMRPAFIAMYNLDLSSTVQVPAGGMLTINLDNMYNPATGNQETRTVSVVNTNGSSVAASAMRDAIAAVLNASGLVVAKANATSVNWLYMYPAVAPLPGCTFTRNDSYILGTQAVVAPAPGFTQFLADYDARGAALEDAQDSITTLNHQVSILETSLLSSSDKGSATPGATSVVITTPAASDTKAIALAALAGFGIGRLTADAFKDQKPKRKGGVDQW